MINYSKPLRFWELVLNPCSHTYGVGSCTASIGVTGDRKCFNSPRTCQDAVNYSPGDEQILRFAEPTADLPIDIDCIPCLTDISRRPQKVDPGETMGVRESGTVSMHNFKHNDVLLDPYLDDRSYNTYSNGTFWGKFFARWGNLQGKECRTVDGFVGQDIDDMERRYYVVEDHAGPDSGGKVSFTFKDILKLLDGDKAQAPAPSKGTLYAEIDESDTSLVLSPPGIGATYPSSGIASIGDEVVSFTRSTDTINLTGRNLYGSKLDGHDAGETFQIALVYSSKSPAELIYDWVTNYTLTPSEYVDLPAWEAEVDENIGRLFSGMIMQPTPVKTLCDEIISEAGLIFFTDLKAKKISLKAMRAFVPTLSLNDDHFIAGSITSSPSNEKRVSEVWAYYGKRNPLEKQDVKKNYTAVYAKPTSNTIVALENTPSAIREITSRWITVFNQPAAVAIADSVLARYEVAPRMVAFKLHPNIPLTEGQAINVSSRIFEDDQGNEAPEFQCQVVQITREMENTAVLAEEVRFTQIAAGINRYIYINESTLSLNLRAVHDMIYTAASSGDIVTLVLAEGVIIGSPSNTGYSLIIGSWPSGVTVRIDGTGRVGAKGGDAGYGSFSEGQDGGNALYTRHPVEIIGDIEIWSGGGGAGGSTYSGGLSIAGGGGAGYLVGLGQSPFATPETGGGGVGPIPAGGGPGLSGAAGASYGGNAGIAVDGISFVTITGTADIRGAQIN